MVHLPRTFLCIFVTLLLSQAYADIKWNSSIPANANFVGTANYVNGAIQLTTKLGDIGAVWWKTPQQISQGFSATIEFYVDINNSPVPKFALVIQANSATIICPAVAYYGFDFTNNVAFVIGADYTQAYYNSNPNLINSGIGAGTSIISQAGQPAGYRKFYIQYSISSGNTVYANITRVGKNYNGQISVSDDIQDSLNLQNGMAWVGFTQANGGTTQFQKMNITSFTFTSNNPALSCSTCSKYASCGLTPDMSALNCTCLPGFQGDGYNCTATNSCNPNPCTGFGPNAYCTLTGDEMAPFNCTCNPGYTLIGFLCTDVNECSLNSSICGPFAACTNLPGGYTCSCLPGYYFSHLGVCTSSCGDGICNASISENCVTCPADCCSSIFLKDSTITYTDTSVAISFSISTNFLRLDNLTLFQLQLSFDNSSFSIYESTELLSVNFVTDRVPRQYYFRVVYHLLKQIINSDVINITTLGCLDGKCSKSIGETCENCPEDCCPELVDCPVCTHGNCENGNCVCDPSYAGVNCNSTTQKFDTIIQPGTVGVQINDETFTLSFTSLSELNPSGQSIFTSPVSPSPSNYSTSDESDFWFAYQLANNAILNVSYNLYAVGEIVLFAKQNISIPPNTLKLTVMISNWPFVNISNSLSLGFKICRNTDCEGIGGNLDWTKTTDHGTIYVKYAKNGIVDGSPAIFGFSYDDTLQTTNLVIPHFWEYAILDPDLSVLVGSNSDSVSPNSKLSMGVIVGITIAAIVALVGIIVIIYMVATRINFKRIQWRLQRDSLSIIPNK